MIALRDVEPKDRDMIRNWRNMPEVAEFMYTDHQISDEEHRLWFERVQSDQSCRYWIITFDDNDVGVANICEIDTENSRCYWGFYIASPSVRGKGVGAFVEYSILKHVLEVLKLNRLCGEVLSFNTSVLRVHEKFGFKQEGVFREHVVKGGVPHDVVGIALLRREWQELKPGIEGRLRARGLLLTGPNE